MKFKMAPNSLFAVLLRSPWWISLAIGALIVVVALTQLPQPYRIAAAMGALPFAGIAVAAMWRQLRLPSAHRSQEVLDAISAMGWAQFSPLLAQGFERDGYRVEPTQGAADFALTRDGRTMLVAARRWKAARHGEDALQALHKAAQSRDASGCLYVALGELSDNAQAFATRNGIELMQAAGLARLLQHAKLPARS